MSWKFILILSSLLRLGLPNWLSIRLSNQNHVYTSPLPHTLHAPPNYSSRVWTIFGKKYRSLNSSLCKLFQSPVTPSILGPNIFLSTVFSKTLSLRSSFIVRNQVWQPHKTRHLHNRLSCNPDRKILLRWTGTNKVYLKDTGDWLCSA